jgi:hypothetical protein
MTATIHQSTKFEHSCDQYYAVAGGYTLLRLTYGSIGGQSGGAIKSATASDAGAAPVYRDRDDLVAMMKIGVQNLGGSAQAVSIDRDRKGRLFGEVTLAGSRDELIEALGQLATEIETLLGREANVDAGYNDLRDMYNDLCHTDGAPVYLSDGLYLGSDGQLFE